MSKLIALLEARKKVKISTNKPIEWKIEDIGPENKVVKTTKSKGYKELGEANDGPSTPVKYDAGMKQIVPNQGAGRVKNVRLKPELLPAGDVLKTFAEFMLELQESSMGEKSKGKYTSGRAGNAMKRQERTAAAVAKKAGLKGTGKLSTKDLRSKPKDYTTYDSENDLDDVGSTEQDHYIRSHSSAREYAKSNLISKRSKDKKVTPSSKSVSKVKDFKKSITKSGASKTGKVHQVDVMHRDSSVGKGDTENQMERGRNFIQAIKDTPKHLEKAGVKKGEAVVGKPTAVMPGEDKKKGEAKRAKLYKNIFGKRSSNASSKTGLMTGKSG